MGCRLGGFNSWADRGGGAEPAVWYHDIFRKDGTPFSKEETDFIRKMTAVAA